MVRSWIYNIKKEELIQYGIEFDIVLTGTVDAMRKEFGEWVEANEGRMPHANRLEALARRHARQSPFKDPITITRNEDKEMDRNAIAAALEKLDFASTSGEAQRRSDQQKQEELRSPWGRSSTMQHNQTNTEYRTTTERNPVRDYAAVAKQVREWSFKFDGNSKPLEFLEQVEWSAETYGLDLDLVPRAMPELLKGTALKWYIANNEHWRTWTSFATSFQEFFLPRDYFTKLLEEVTRRKQGVDEPFKRYMVEMQTLMRPLRFSKERERQQIYSCSLPDFRAFARPYQNGSLIELMQLAEEFEELERDRERLRQHTRQNRSRLMAIEDSRPRENNAPCTRCADHASTQPQPTPRAFSGPPTHTASGSQERADADRNSSTVVGALRAEGHRLTATVQIGNKSYNATIDTGATSSFVSEELAVTLCEEGFGLGATQRQVRLADGRSSGVSEHVEVQIQLGDRQVDLPLLVLPGVIDELVLGWDFLSHMGAILECAGIQVRIPARRRHDKGREERLSVVNTQDQTTRIQENQEQGTRDNQSTQEQTTQEQGTLQETRKAQDHATAKEQTKAEEPGHTMNGGINCEPLHADPAIDSFLQQEIAAFATMTGTSPITEHRIVMHDDRPIKQRYFPKNPKMQEEINKQVDELLAKGCIEPSNSPHSAPIVMVKKKTGKWRLCVDFRQLNSRSVKDAYPLPRVHHILDQLREAHYITSLDLKDGYWQIPMEKASRPLTAFTVPGRGLFQWKVMPFGLHAAPATFQRALDRVIGPEMLPHAFAYLDDIIVIGKTLEEHMANLKEVFRRLRAANLKINVDKCDFFKQELKYLGHKVTEHGICTDPEKVDAISKLKPPTNAKELRQYLGVASCEMSSKVSSKKGGSSSIRRKSGKQAPPTRLPFHPRRSTRKPPPLELETERFPTLPADTDVLELATSPILDFGGLTPPPTSSPKPAGAVFRWPVGEEEEAPPPPPPEKPLAKPLARPPVQPPEQQPIQPPVQAQVQPPPVQPPPVQPPPVQPPPVQPPPVQPSATGKGAQPRASKRAEKPPVRPLTPTIYEVLDSDEEEPEPRRVRFDTAIQRQVPMTPGRQIDAAEYAPPPLPPPSPATPPLPPPSPATPPPPPPPAPPSRWQEMVGIAWPAEVAQEARRLIKGGRRRTHLVWSGGRRYQVKASHGRVRVFRDQQQQQ
ncbi:hypothetical protein ACLKA7_001571 [Drosophila subpalustris]